MIHFVAQTYLDFYGFYPLYNDYLVLTKEGGGHPISQKVGKKIDEVDSFQDYLSGKFKNDLNKFFQFLKTKQNRFVLLTDSAVLDLLLVIQLKTLCKNDHSENLFRLYSLYKKSWVVKKMFKIRKDIDYMQGFQPPFQLETQIEFNDFLEENENYLNQEIKENILNIDFAYINACTSLNEHFFTKDIQKIVDLAWREEYKEIKEALLDRLDFIDKWDENAIKKNYDNYKKIHLGDNPKSLLGADLFLNKDYSSLLSELSQGKICSAWLLQYFYQHFQVFSLKNNKMDMSQYNFQIKEEQYDTSI